MATQNSKKLKKVTTGKAKPAKTTAKKPVKKAPAKAKPVAKSKPAAKATKGKKPVAAKSKPAVKAKAPAKAKAVAKPKAKPAAKPVAKAKPVVKKPAPVVKAGIAPKSGAKTKSSKPAVVVNTPKAKSPAVGTLAPKKVSSQAGSSQNKIVQKPVATPVVKPPVVKPQLGSKASDLTKKPTVSTVAGSIKPNQVFKPKTTPFIPSKPKTELKVKPIEKMTEKKDFKPATMTVASEEPHKTRYSDKELEEFDLLIDQKLIVAREQLEFYLKQLEDMAENPDNKIKGLDDGLSTLESERVSSLASRQQKLIQHLENAKIRIKNKVYGICRETGKLISKERLRAVPHATLSIEAKQAQN